MKRIGPGNAALRPHPVVRPEPVHEPQRALPFLIDEDYLRQEHRRSRNARLQQWAQFAAFVAYAAVVAVTIPFHEPWADEAQAWLLARDQSLSQLLFHAIRYEGSPGLWHSFLWSLSRMHVGYIGMRWISGLVALAGVYVLLRWSPFPLILKVLLPFGFWLAYQDAVVARSDVLFAILAFPAAAILRSISHAETPLRRGALIWLAVLLGTLANLSVYDFVASIGFAIVALVLLRRRRQAGFPVAKTIPAEILCCFWLFALVTVFPPSDVEFPAGRNIQLYTEKIWATFGNPTARAELQQEKFGDRWTRPGELSMQPSPSLQQTASEVRWHKIARVLGLLTFPVSNFRILAVVALALVILQIMVFRRAGGHIGWIGLVPWALMIGVFASMDLAPRHAGMIWEALIVSLWLTWPAEVSSRWYEKGVYGLTVAALMVVGLNQVQWTAHAVWADIHQPYSGDKAMAQWLKTNEAGKRIAGFGYPSVGVTAWFHDPLYFNQPATYWIWSQEPRVDERAPFTIATHPDVIIFGGWNASEHDADIGEDWVKPRLATLNSVPLNDDYRIIPYAEAHGYRETHRFCGHAFMRSGYSEELCQVALEPVPGWVPPHPDVASNLIPVPNESTIR